MERRNIEVELEPLGTCGDEHFVMSVTSVIDVLQKTLAAIPEEFRADATLRIWGSGEYVSIYPEVRYERPETDEEFAARKAEHERRERQAAAAQEQYDRAHYERLKKKYG